MKRLTRILLPALIALTAVLIFTGCGTSSGDKKTYRQVSPEEAAAMMEEETDYIILDVRTQEEYENTHIPGAICISNETIEPEDTTELPDKNWIIIVYCRSVNRSKQASKKLAKKGYTNIVEFDDTNGWTGETVSSSDK